MSFLSLRRNLRLLSRLKVDGVSIKASGLKSHYEHMIHSIAKVVWFFLVFQIPPTGNVHGQVGWV